MMIAKGEMLIILNILTVKSCGTSCSVFVKYLRFDYAALDLIMHLNEF